jgi:hypothetical protein
VDDGDFVGWIAMRNECVKSICGSGVFIGEREENSKLSHDLYIDKKKFSYQKYYHFISP